MTSNAFLKQKKSKKSGHDAFFSPVSKLHYEMAAAKHFAKGAFSKFANTINEKTIT